VWKGREPLSHLINAGFDACSDLWGEFEESSIEGRIPPTAHSSKWSLSGRFAPGDKVDPAGGPGISSEHHWNTADHFIQAPGFRLETAHRAMNAASVHFSCLRTIIRSQSQTPKLYYDKTFRVIPVVFCIRFRTIAVKLFGVGRHSTHGLE
jgi:hypothetical protein